MVSSFNRISAYVLSVFLIGCVSSALGQQAQRNFTKQITANYISDLALIYQGGTHRMAWTRDQLKPYVFRTDAGGFEWLFDGFLFIEFKDNIGTEYAEGYGFKPAGKQQWLWLLNRNFEKGKAISALNSLLDSLAQKGKRPVRKRKVVLTIPEPIKSNTNWGKINGRRLNFSSNADRIAACKWYIDQALAMWQKSGFKHIELAGFYWVAERDFDAQTVLPAVSAKVKSKGKRFFWIPYYGAKGAGNWKTLGFDVAYQQPNYFFKLNTPRKILTGAIDFARNNQMAVEMEFDKRVITEDGFRKKFSDYLDEFEKAGAISNSPVAYYDGGGAWYEMSLQKNAKVKQLVNRLADIIAERQKEVDAGPR